MRPITRKTLILSMCALAMAGCNGIPTYIYRDFERVDWDYVQSVGGIAMGDPYIDGADLKIPLIQDFSGSRNITVEPTRKEGTLLCAAVDASASWNGVVTTVYIDMWASEPAYMSSPAARGCDEVALPLIGMAPLKRVRVKLRSSRFDYRGQLIGEFSL